MYLKNQTKTMLRKLFLNDKFILCLILINSIVLFCDGYVPKDSSLKFLSFVDTFISILFVVELIIKLNNFGLKDYFKSGWNRLDFVLVLFSVPTLMSVIFKLDITDFSFLLVFRILRVFKAFRFFKFLPNVGKLVEGLSRAMKASVFVFIGFVIYIFIVGMLSYSLFNQSGCELFINPLISLFSTFRIFTVEGWSEIPAQVAVDYSPFATFSTYLYFVFVVLTGGIFGLSIVNSIFVDAMVSDNNDELETKVESIDIKVTEILNKLNSYETRKNT